MDLDANQLAAINSAIEKGIKQHVNGKVDAMRSELNAFMVTMEPLVELLKVSRTMRAFAVFAGPIMVLVAGAWSFIKWIR